MSEKKLLFVDDDLEVLKINKKYFETEGFKVKVTNSAKEAKKIVTNFSPDLIVLDVMMPDIDGFGICKALRKITKVPILFLSGKIDEEAKIKGFSLGGDDYLEKPCSLLELKARIIANIRRSQTYDNNSSIKNFGNLSIDEKSHKVSWMDEEISLSKREYQLLSFFLEKEGDIVTFEDIGKEMFGMYSEDDRRVVMVQVSRLRKKLNAYAKDNELIETIWSKGYKFSAR
ncbi:DNA-binding response regulator, OmpR family, contains REC and winged-helix (wHTH) domain [Acetitomaculum ruminis DSM 5522]|uniref:Stage 0 sporulation protein A homolog n=1 Tax=Acetitomaculum ruminis DSM 5522 TaxID=1120918 RepID=A0A1I0YKU0_9FIRM|nr:response regulator transcription factor [Acetitomaculum ruminis]SFB14009.1 DNA-binding response regulator, OmpR family, contains REC and winged-helix (wHTH) domain [Acetitomaculum ruminis DSM 5522]